MKFAPIHVISGYSFLQSGLTMDKIVRSVKSNDYYGLALSDNEVMYGLAPLAKAMASLNKPYLFGEQFLINEDVLCLYALNEKGYHNLIRLNLESQRNGLTLSFLKDNKEGLAAVIETVRGKFKEKFENSDSDFNHYLLDYSSIYGDNFYLGIEVTSKEEAGYANKIRRFANEYTYECIAFPRIRYEKKEDAITIKIVEAIADDNRIKERKEDGQEYFMLESNYEKIYTKKEMDNTVKLISSSTFKFDNKRGELLHYPVDDAKESLKQLCFDSLKRLNLEEEKYICRLNHELEVIFEMGYADYFLIVQDYVKYAKENGILVGPGRGSAAGSLVSYLLGITEVDPLKYDLQFERFLNPYRKTMPDIDVDFMDISREAMFTYMRQKYGTSRVGNIVTFQTIGAKQSLRDIGRIYEFPERYISLLSKNITIKDASLREAYKKIPEFKKIVDSDKEFLTIVSLASKIEGLPRQSGLHPAGVILNNNPLDESVPVSVDMNDNYITQYEAEYLESQGFLKMDFLALSNLTIIYNCVNLINRNHKDANINPYTIPYEEKEIFDLISSNKTMGLFQIETTPMKRAIKILKPSCFDDVVALIALCRPGPMTYIPTYSNRKTGKEKYTFISEELKDILSPTYGIIIYQEQVNSIATKMAGFSLSEADMFRRAVSKKDKAQLGALEKQFVEGSINNGYKREEAQKVFADILRFADYGFNKSHSVVYSIIACRMAYLKVHYPLEFYAALFDSSAATSDTKFNEYVIEMKQMGIKLLPPSINHSSFNFAIKDNSLLLPLTAIRGVNITLMEKINEERKENGLFKDYYNFALRMYPRGINESQILALIDGGALDEFHPSRQSMRMNAKAALQYAELNYSEDGQLSIGIEAFGAPLLREFKDDPIDNLNREYEAIGIMLSDNPLRYKKELLEKEKAISINEAKEKREAIIAGIIKDKKIISTKKGDQMAFIKLFDEYDEVEITLFPNAYNESSSLLIKNNIIVAKIKREIKGDQVTYIADQIHNLEEEEN